MILVADLGASKVKVAAYAFQKSELKLVHLERYWTKNYLGLSAILAEFVFTHSLKKISALGVGVAGPILGDVTRPTNVPWELSKDELRRALGVSRVEFLNDVEAHGYGLAFLHESDLFSIQAEARAGGNQVLLAVGTGLGQCILYNKAGVLLPVASEGGHSDFSPNNPEEAELLAHLWKKYQGHVSWERVVSGRFGFRNLYDFLLETGRVPSTPSFSVKVRGKEDIGLEIQEGAEDGVPEAVLVSQWFMRLCAAEAGNLALKGLARGGVFLAGGVARRMQGLIRKGLPEFRDAFSRKGRMEHLLKSLPVDLVLDPNLAVRGLAQYVVLQSGSPVN